VIALERGESLMNLSASRITALRARFSPKTRFVHAFSCGISLVRLNQSGFRETLSWRAAHNTCGG
jgi:hypothetical protein